MWELDHTEGWAPKNWYFQSVVLKTLESLLEAFKQGNQTSQEQRKSTLNIHCKNWCWSWSSNTMATWYKELSHWKRPWFWERWRERGEGGNKGWDSWVGIADSMDMSLSKLQEVVMNREAWHAAVHEFAKNQTWFSNWTSTMNYLPERSICYNWRTYMNTSLLLKVHSFHEVPSWFCTFSEFEK